MVSPEEPIAGSTIFCWSDRDARIAERIVDKFEGESVRRAVREDARREEAQLLDNLREPDDGAYWDTGTTGC